MDTLPLETVSNSTFGLQLADEWPAASFACSYKLKTALLLIDWTSDFGSALSWSVWCHSLADFTTVTTVLFSYVTWKPFESIKVRLSKPERPINLSAQVSIVRMKLSLLSKLIAKGRKPGNVISPVIWSGSSPSASTKHPCSEQFWIGILKISLAWQGHTAPKVPAKWGRLFQLKKCSSGVQPVHVDQLAGYSW